MAKRKRRLTMHPDLLMKVINDQSCVLEKALLEGNMNAIEAGSEEVRNIFVEGKGKWKHGLITIEDDGIGIRNEQEVAEFFDQFGRPHDDSENIIWKRFRMGRGQLFAYGRNTWRTSTFKMVVDIKNNGLDYDFEDGLPPFDGTKIEVELYENPFKWSYSSVDALMDRIKHQVEYMPGRILFNGTRLNTPADDIDPARWTEVDDDAYYLFGMGSKLTIYNLGAYVMDLPPTDMGVTGVIVSRKVLDVNFARGGVHDRCEVYKRIKQIIKKHKPARQRKQPKYLEDWEKASLLQDLRDGDDGLDLRNLKTIKTFRCSTTRSMSLAEIRQIRSPWTFAPLGDRIADRLMQAETCICLDEQMLTELNYTGEPENFFKWLMRRQDYREQKAFEHLAGFYEDFKQASSGMSRSHKIIPTEKWTKREKRIVNVLNRWGSYWKGRNICIGVASARAWTDGRSYISLERTWLKELRINSPSGARELLTTMCHELTHDECTDCTHIHGEAFYRHYHDITMNYNSPLDLCAYLHNELRKVKNQEHHDDQKQKEFKATARVKAKLGTDASTSPVKIAARIKVAPKPRRKGVGRIPPGALAVV